MRLGQRKKRETARMKEIIKIRQHKMESQASPSNYLARGSSLQQQARMTLFQSNGHLDSLFDPHRLTRRTLRTDQTLTVVDEDPLWSCSHKVV
jgi:hypothetical protein